MSDDLMTMTQAAAYLHFSHRSVAAAWLRKEDVKMHWRGRALLVRKSAIDAALEKHATGDTEARARAMSRR